MSATDSQALHISMAFVVAEFLVPSTQHLTQQFPPLSLSRFNSFIFLSLPSPSLPIPSPPRLIIFLPKSSDGIFVNLLLKPQAIHSSEHLVTMLGCLNEWLQGLVQFFFVLLGWFSFVYFGGGWWPAKCELPHLRKRRSSWTVHAVGSASVRTVW